MLRLESAYCDRIDQNACRGVPVDGAVSGEALRLLHGSEANHFLAFLGNDRDVLRGEAVNDPHKASQKSAKEYDENKIGGGLDEPHGRNSNRVNKYINKGA